jgi:hypothetical protein
MAKVNLTDFLDYLNSHVNKGIYVWGGQGEDLKALTEQKIRSMETSSNNANRAIRLWKQRKDIKGAKAFDCSGLIMYYLCNKKKIYGDMTANNLKNKCTLISKSQLRAGDFVFKCYASGHAYHIGVYDGEKVIESQGRDLGVVKRSISANGWNKYGRLDIFDDFVAEAITETKPKGSVTVNTIVVKKGVKGEPVKAMQSILKGLGYTDGDGKALEIDGSCGTKSVAAIKKFQKAKGLEVDGSCGAKTWNRLLNG